MIPKSFCLRMDLTLREEYLMKNFVCSWWQISLCNY